MSVVWELNLPPGEKLVLLALADQANDEGTHCWPSVATISKRSGQNERTVRRALRSLEGKGHLTCNERRGTSTNYVVHPGHHAPPVKLPPRTKTTQTPDTTPPHPGHHAPQTINEPLEPSIDAKASKRVRERKPEIVIPDWIPQPAWTGWLDSRKAKATPHVVELAIGKLEKLRRDGHDPGEVLNQSSLNGWRGLFPLKDSSNGHARQSNPKPRTEPALELLRNAEAALAASASRNSPDSGGHWPALPDYLTN